MVTEGNALPLGVDAERGYIMMVYIVRRDKPRLDECLCTAVVDIDGGEVHGPRLQ
jgi:hypothetical protein